MPTKVLGDRVPQDAYSFARGSVPMTRVPVRVVCVGSPVDPLHHAIGTPARCPKHLALDSLLSLQASLPGRSTSGCRRCGQRSPTRLSCTPL